MVSGISTNRIDTDTALVQDRTKEDLFQAKKIKRQKILDAKLLDAVLMDLPEEVSRLIKMGANPNWCDNDNVSLLHLVSSAKVAQILIDARANVNAKDNYGCCPIHFAKDAAVLRVLLAQPTIDVNALDDSNQSALFFANAECTRLLLAKGAKPDVKDKQGRRPLHLASEEQTVVLLEAGVDVNLRDNDGRTAMFGATPGKAQKLFEKGATVTVADNQGFTPLHTAENLEEAMFFVSHGVQVNALNIHNETPILHAHDEDHIEYLLTHGARVDIPLLKSGLMPFEFPHIRTVYARLNGFREKTEHLQEVSKSPLLVGYLDRVRDSLTR